MPAKTKQSPEEFLESLHDTLATIFHGAQTSNASHKRRIKTLCQLHSDAASHTQRKQGKRGQEDSIILVGEKAFNRAFWQITLCTLGVKRGVVEADRTIRFIGTFMGALMGMEENNEEDEDEDEETSRDRFLQRSISHILPGCSAKDKTPRFRCTQLLSEILRNVPSLDDELFMAIKTALLERVSDKEWTIRAVACHGLGVLARAEASIDDEEDEAVSGTGPRITDILQALCQYDLQPHVRIAALPGISLPLNVGTLPFLLSRTRDIDASVRKSAFRIVQQVPVRGLSVAQRSLIIRNGLGDREASVRAEVGKLVYHWAVTCSDYQGGSQPKGRGQKLDVKIDLDEFLDLFDLWDGTVAEEALKALIYKRPNILGGLDLSKEDYWSDFTPSKALLARVFTELATSTSTAPPFNANESSSLGNALPSFGANSSINASNYAGNTTIAPLDFSKHIDALPVLTFQAFNIQSLFNLVVQSVRLMNETESDMPSLPGADKEDLEEQIEDCVFSLGEMLKMARYLLDGMEGDEVGRRKVFGLVRDILIHPYFPNTLLTPALALLLRVANGVADFINTILRPLLDDVIKEEKRKDLDVSRRYTLNAKRRAKDEGDSDDERASNEGDEEEESIIEQEDDDDARIKKLFLRLCVVNEVLEVVEWPSSDDETLRNLQRHLVRPALAVHASYPQASEGTKARVFDAALKCLGLIAIADETLALNALAFSVRGIRGGIPPRHIKGVIECIVDIVMSHSKMTELSFGDVVKEAPPELAEIPFLPVLLVNSLQSDNETVQATTAVGVCKLFLCGMWFNDQLLEALVLLYFLPDTASNTTVRQCLSYFFPAFCYSSPTNQERLSKVILGAFIKLCPVYESLKDEADADNEESMISPERVITMLLEYTNSSNLVESAKNDEQKAASEHLHITLAVEMLEKITLLLENKEDDDPAICCISPMCHGLNRLHFPSDMAAASLQRLLTALSEILTNHTPDDKSAFRQLTTFEGKLRRLWSKRKEDVAVDHSDDESELRRKEGNKRKRNGRSEDEDETLRNARAPKRRYTQNRAASPVSDKEDVAESHEEPVEPKAPPGKAKARLRSTLDDSGSGSASDEGATSKRPTPPRKKRRSSATVAILPSNAKPQLKNTSKGGGRPAKSRQE